LWQDRFCCSGSVASAARSALNASAHHVGCSTAYQQREALVPADGQGHPPASALTGCSMSSSTGAFSASQQNGCAPGSRLAGQHMYAKALIKMCIVQARKSSRRAWNATVVVFLDDLWCGFVRSWIVGRASTKHARREAAQTEVHSRGSTLQLDRPITCASTAAQPLRIRLPFVSRLQRPPGVCRRASRERSRPFCF